jgi:hypothetical protein
MLTTSNRWRSLKASSVVGVGDALFSGVASQQTYRWWKTTEPVS